MEDVINKVCSTLIKDPHVIGIILNCDYDSEKTYMGQLEDSNKHINLCIISKEAGNQKTIYMEDDYIVCLRWRTEDEFIRLNLNKKREISEKKVLYDKLGIMNNLFQTA